MKSFITLVILIATTSLPAQVNILAGTYSNKTDATKMNSLSWDLELAKDGTFEYHYHRKLPNQEEENIYGKGTWTSEKLVVTFHTTDSDFDSKYTKNLNNTKARSTWVSPLRKSSTDEKVHIRFVTSEDDLKDVKLYKN